jgi:hypothetical protein
MGNKIIMALRRPSCSPTEPPGNPCGVEQVARSEVQLLVEGAEKTADHPVMAPRGRRRIAAAAMNVDARLRVLVQADRDDDVVHVSA